MGGLLLFDRVPSVGQWALASSGSAASVKGFVIVGSKGLLGGTILYLSTASGIADDCIIFVAGLGVGGVSAGVSWHWVGVVVSCILSVGGGGGVVIWVSPSRGLASGLVLVIICT